MSTLILNFDGQSLRCLSILLGFRVFWIGAITIPVYLKYAIIIHVSETLPLQFSLSLKSAIVYARQTFGPACKLTWHMIDRIRPYPIFM
jgi:hypothetical protein